MIELLPGVASIVATRSVFLRKEALAAGYDDRTVQILTRAGEWVRVRSGAYTTREIWGAADENRRHILRAKAQRAASKSTGVNSHTTSVVLLGGPTYNLSLDDVHLTRLKGNAGRCEAGVRHHRSDVSDADCMITDDLPHTKAARAVLEILATTDVTTALCVGNHFLHQGIATMQEIGDAADRAERWPGTLGVDALLLRLDGRIESVAETLFENLCFHNGVRGYVPQFEVCGGGSHLGRVDFAFPAHGVFVEIDGKGKYTTLRRADETAEDVLWREKTRQERICAATGWECIRFTWADLMNPAATLKRLREALERGGHRMSALQRQTR